MADAAQRHHVVVRSLGSSGLGVVHALKQVLSATDQEIARKILQAPSILLRGVERELAARIAGLLGKAGLDVAAVPEDEPVLPGDGDHEVALRLEGYDRMAEIIREIRLLMGCGVADAARIACAVPAALMGNLSRNTAESIRARFAPLGVHVDISAPANARFTCIADTEQADRQIARLGHAAACEPAQGDAAGAATIYVGLSHEAAQSIWATTRRLGLAPTIVNEDFARFDLLLEAAPHSPGLAAMLSSRLGIPGDIIPRMLASLPIVVLRNATRAEAEDAAQAIAAHGGTARPLLLAMQRFAVVVDAVGDRTAMQQLLEFIGGFDPAEARRALDAGTAVGRITSTRAKWLQYAAKSSRAGNLRVMRVGR